MYATTLFVCAILAQTPPNTSGDAPGKPPADTGSANAAPAAGARPDADSPSAPANKAGGYESEAPPFQSGAPAAAANADPTKAQQPATQQPAAPQSAVDTPPPTADEIAAEEQAARRAAEAKASSERATPAAAEVPVDKSLVPVQPRAAIRNLATEVLASALKLPEQGRVSGRPITLVDVLRQVPDRPGQLKATEEYWKLVEAVAVYHFALDECQQLERLKPAAQPNVEPTPDEQLMSTRIAAAQASMRDAERALVTAQYDLAGAMKLRAGLPYPLPVDAPHVGPYSTLLYEMYQAKGLTTPPRAVLLDRTMPIRRSAVDARALAVQSATDALDAVEEAYYEQRADLKLVLSLIEELSRQRRAFFADVRAYNNEIAEYAMGVPPPPGGAVALASMLIRPTTTAAPANSGIMQVGGTTTGGATSGVERAGLNAPIGQSSVAPPPPAQPPNSPRGAPAGAAPKAGEPTLAPPRGSADRQEPGKLSTGARDAASSAAQYQTNRPQSSAENDPVASEPSTADPAAADAATTTDAAAPTTDPSAPPEMTLYPALLDLPSDEQAKHLAGILFWHPADATPDIAPVTLAEFLAAVRPEGRQRALAAYWQSQRMAATRGAMVAQIEQFDSLDQELQRAMDKLDPAAALLVRAGRSAAEADARRAEADCKIAQWDLAMLMGRPATGAWLAPATAPHAGGYRLNLDDLPQTLKESSDLQRLATTIARRPQSFCQRAAAVVSADKSRADEVARSGGTLDGVDRAMQAIGAQTEYTIAFATDLAEYNQNLADYALLVLPASTPSPMLVQALVLSK